MTVIKGAVGGHGPAPSTPPPAQAKPATRPGLLAGWVVDREPPIPPVHARSLLDETMPRSAPLAYIRTNPVTGEETVFDPAEITMVRPSPPAESVTRRVPLADARAARTRDQVPAWIVRIPEPMTEAEMDDLRARWKDANVGPVLVLSPDDGTRHVFLTSHPRRGEARTQTALARYVAATRPAPRRPWRRRWLTRKALP